ncbi:enoyl-CoA hydratase-related protein [Ramlibacter tataouinensis]|uniref:enoyl-CoA hydratase-related protein n=1 Tax=Ramlibacter tataouinensis TaxID=94132 RepID=UPI0022F3D191|nr:enoyl-CoA hydratase-related protein [Ramlibacter tataouinensis]WBY03583.1 enoyl-CoA hydratase-related protein [Ramlibacter tataouinensis]
MSTLLRTRSSDGVLRITLHRPQVRNAFDAALLEELRLAFEEAAADASVRIVVLGGAGTHFCAGGDIEWMKRVLAASPEEKRVHAMQVAGMYRAVHALPQPLVAQVQGTAMGGGMGLVCCADFVVAAADARFALSENRLGIVPAAISPYMVAALGARRAVQLALAGETVDVQRAREIGLVTHVAAPGALEAEVRGLLAQLLGSASGAQRQTKSLLRAVEAQAPDAHREALAVDALVTAWSGGEAAEGFRAFLERSVPPWRVTPVQQHPAAAG